jgi:hypothetical protein
MKANRLNGRALRPKRAEGNLTLSFSRAVENRDGCLPKSGEPCILVCL